MPCSSSARKDANVVVHTKGQFVSAVYLPEMPGLAVQSHDFSHGLELDLLPVVVVVGGRLGMNQHSRRDLEFMRVPKPLLFWIKCLVDMFRDHVFHANQFGVFGRRIVD